MESDTGLAVDSNRAIGIELMEQATERVTGQPWNKQQRVWWEIAKTIAEVQALIGEVNNNDRRVCLYQLQSFLVCFCTKGKWRIVFEFLFWKN